MKKIFSILLIINCSLLITKAQWFEQNSGTSQHLYDVFFIDTNTGWACGNNGTLIKTTNGGNNWFSQNSGVTNRPLISIFFVNENIGWIATRTTGIIKKTTDGGNNWFEQLNTNDASFETIYFIDSLIGWVCGSGTNGDIFKTTNGGNNWDSINIVNGGTDIQFINSQTGWAAFGPLLYKSTDSGINWSLQFNNIGYGDIESFSFLNLNTGYFVTEATWTVYKTTNGGNNWMLLDTLPDCYNAGKIFFINVNTGWVCGDCGQLFSTTNGGLNWYQQATNIINFLTSVVFVTDSIGWVVGGLGHILHTSNGGSIIGISGSGNEVPAQNELYQNYPNPFNPATNIKYQIINNNSYVKLIVFDLLGRHIIDLVNQKQGAGTYEVDFDGSELPSGVYFYSLTVNGNILGSKKLVLIK